MPSYKSRSLLFQMLIPFAALIAAGAAIITALVLAQVAGGHDKPIIIQGGSQTIWSEGGFLTVNAALLEVQRSGYKATTVHIYNSRPADQPNPSSDSTYSVYGNTFAVCTDAPHYTAIYSADGNDVRAVSYNSLNASVFVIFPPILDASFFIGHQHQVRNYMGTRHRLYVGGAGNPSDCQQSALKPVQLNCSTANGKCFIQIDYCDNQACADTDQSFVGALGRFLH